MADPNERWYWGDFRLADHGMDHDDGSERSGVLEFTGVGRKRRLVIAANANHDGSVDCQTVLLSGTAPATRTGFRARKRKLLAELVARSQRQDPLVWVEDTARSRAVTSYATGTLTTTAAHGLATGDVVLIRRLGAGLWTLATFTSTGASTGTLVAVTGGQIHAIAAADEVHLVEGYWIGMVLTQLPRVAPQDDDHWGICAFSFKGSGEYSYSRTSASVGS